MYNLYTPDVQKVQINVNVYYPIAELIQAVQLCDMSSKEDLKKEVLEWIKQQKWNKKFYSVPIQQFIHFTKSGMKHALKRNYKSSNVEIRLIKDIPKILSDSYYMGFSKNTDIKDKNTKGVHNYYAIVVLDKNIYEVWLKVKETRDKTYFYDHGVIRKI